jgi:hypothetical protein
METKYARQPVLYEEYKIYEEMNSEPRNPVLPCVHWFGETLKSNVLVMDLCGPTLE